jgi:hypothetical protein
MRRKRKILHSQAKPARKNRERQDAEPGARAESEAAGCGWSEPGGTPGRTNDNDHDNDNDKNIICQTASG